MRGAGRQRLQEAGDGGHRTLAGRSAQSPLGACPPTPVMRSGSPQIPRPHSLQLHRAPGRASQRRQGLDNHGEEGEG